MANFLLCNRKNREFLVKIVRIEAFQDLQVVLIKIMADSFHFKGEVPTDLKMDIKGVKDQVLINLRRDVSQYTLGSCTNLNLLNIVFGR